jgi:hypothetical protein
VVAGWALVLKIAGSYPSEAVGLLKAKNSSACLRSFGEEVTSSVKCRSFSACKIYLNDVEIVISAKVLYIILAHISPFRCGRGGTWRRKWELIKGGEINSDTSLKTCPGCIVP